MRPCRTRRRLARFVNEGRSKELARARPAAKARPGVERIQAASWTGVVKATSGSLVW